MEDRFTWDMIEFVVNWAPYGEASEEEVFPRFGMNGQDLQIRVCDLVCRLALTHHGSLSRQLHELLNHALATVGLCGERPTNGSSSHPLAADDKDPVSASRRSTEHPKQHLNDSSCLLTET